MKSPALFPGRQFAGVPEADIVKRIASRAYRLRLPRSDIDDVQQEVFDALTKATFDPQRANGATPLTFITSIIDHKILQHKRANERRERRCAIVDLTDDSNECETDADPDGEGSADTSANPVGALEAPRDPVELKIDVRDALATLSPRERRVCVALGEGRRVTEIAPMLGCSRGTVDHIIERVRQQFSELGLHEWITGQEEAPR